MSIVTISQYMVRYLGFQSEEKIMKSTLIALFLLSTTAFASAATFDGLLCETDSAATAAKVIAVAPALTVDADTKSIEAQLSDFLANGTCALLSGVDESALTNATFAVATGGERVGTVLINGKTFVFVDLDL